MKLVSIFPEQIHAGEPLPFALRDAGGRLLLATGLTLDPSQLAELLAQPVFAEEHEAADWQRRVVAAMDQALRQGALLHQVAAARPEAPRDTADISRARTFAEQWEEIGWDQAFAEIGERTRTILARDADSAAMYIGNPNAHSYANSLVSGELKKALGLSLDAEEQRVEDAHNKKNS